MSVMFCVAWLFLYSSPSACGDLWMTELHPDPIQLPDAEGEFIELYNPSRLSQSTHGWQLLVNGKKYPLPRHMLPAKRAVVFARSAWAAVDGVVVMNMRLPNRQADVHLIDRCGVARQAIRWGRGHRLRARKGRSLELIIRRQRPAWRQSLRRDVKLGEFAGPGRVSSRLSRSLAARETLPLPTASTPIGSRQTGHRIGD